MSDDVWMPPEIIYLVRDDEESEVCWCSERINDTDVEYRRVPAPQGSVPDHVRSVLHAALIVYITECRELDDPDGEMYARQAQQWLDSQRPSQGHLDIAERRIAELEAKLAQGNVTGGGDGER